MIHNHEDVAVNQLRKYLVLTNSGKEFTIESFDDIEAGYRAIHICGEHNEELKDVTPL